LIIERTLSDLEHDFGTGTRVEERITGKKGIVLMRDMHLGAWVLWDGMDQPLHQGSAASLIGLGPRMTAVELSARRAAALDSTSGIPIDPFDTKGLDNL
jgi:hypothetical protein